MDETVVIDETLASGVYTQDYSPKQTIEGVKVITVKNFLGEDGDFSEVVRIADNGSLESFPDFKLAQINRTKVIPGSVKAWHLHLSQDEIWYLMPGSNLFVGLWDVRKNSKTRGQNMRLVLGEGGTNIVFIPKGVAHGSANFSNEPIQLIYFVNKQFNSESPDEKRIKWDALSARFWEPQRD